MKCEKSMCGKNLQLCPVCKGSGGGTGGFGNKLNCTTCGNTGLVCPEHGKYWKK
jgi:hypothetical protein